MIRSVSYRKLKASMTTEQFNALMTEKKTRDLIVESSVVDIVRRYKKGEITFKEKVELEKPIYDNYTTWALANGIYEEVTQEQLDNEEIDNIIFQVQTLRSKQNKSELTELEIKTLLLS